MGIDAEILVRVPRPVSDDELKVLSFNICTSLGASRFGVNRETGQGAIRLAGYKKPGKVYEQDGPDIEARSEETLLSVNLWSRYYGIGYERGDLLTIIAVAEWCEQNIVPCEVWYGGDSSGIVAEPFTTECRKELLKHFYSSHGRDYFNHEFLTGTEAPYPNLSNCKLCIVGKPLNRYGWGQNFAAYICPGCGQRFITKDGGTTWADKE